MGLWWELPAPAPLCCSRPPIPARALSHSRLFLALFSSVQLKNLFLTFSWGRGARAGRGGQERADGEGFCEPSWSSLGRGRVRGSPVAPGTPHWGDPGWVPLLQVPAVSRLSELCFPKGCSRRAARSARGSRGGNESGEETCSGNLFWERGAWRAPGGGSTFQGTAEAWAGLCRQLRDSKTLGRNLDNAAFFFLF